MKRKRISKQINTERGSLLKWGDDSAEGLKMMWKCSISLAALSLYGYGKRPRKINVLKEEHLKEASEFPFLGPRDSTYQTVMSSPWDHRCRGHCKDPLVPSVTGVWTQGSELTEAESKLMVQGQGVQRLPNRSRAMRVLCLARDTYEKKPSILQPSVEHLRAPATFSPPFLLLTRDREISLPERALCVQAETTLCHKGLSTPCPHIWMWEFLPLQTRGNLGHCPTY